MDFFEGLKKAKSKVDEGVTAFKKTPVGRNMSESFEEKPVKMTLGLTGAAALGAGLAVGAAEIVNPGDDLLTPEGVSYSEPAPEIPGETVTNVKLSEPVRDPFPGTTQSEAAE